MSEEPQAKPPPFKSYRVNIYTVQCSHILTLFICNRCTYGVYMYSSAMHHRSRPLPSTWAHVLYHYATSYPWIILSQLQNTLSTLYSFDIVMKITKRFQADSPYVTPMLLSYYLSRRKSVYLYNIRPLFSMVIDSLWVMMWWWMRWAARKEQIMLPNSIVSILTNMARFYSMLGGTIAQKTQRWEGKSGRAETRYIPTINGPRRYRFTVWSTSNWNLMWYNFLPICLFSWLFEIIFDSSPTRTILIYFCVLVNWVWPQRHVPRTLRQLSVQDFTTWRIYVTTRGASCWW